MLSPKDQGRTNNGMHPTPWLSLREFGHFGESFLHAVFAEDFYACCDSGADAFGFNGFADGNERHLIARTACALAGRGDARFKVSYVLCDVFKSHLNQELLLLFRFDVSLPMLNGDELRINLIAEVGLDDDLAALALFARIGRRITEAVLIAHFGCDVLQ